MQLGSMLMQAGISGDIAGNEEDSEVARKGRQLINRGKVRHAH